MRRRRSRLTLPARPYGPTEPDPSVPLQVQRVDVYRETPPDNIALPLETGAHASVWVRRVVWIAVTDEQPMQIQVSWIPGLDGDAEKTLRQVDPDTPWLAAVDAVTGRSVATVMQYTRARGANPWEAEVFGIPDKTKVLVTHATLYERKRRPIEHSRYTWLTDAAAWPRTGDLV